MKAMKPNSIAIFCSNDQMPRSADLLYNFRQNPDLFYFTGIDQEETILVMYPDCPKGEKFREVLFLRETNEYIKVWEGYKFTKEEGTQTSGIERVMWTNKLNPTLNEMILLADNIYLNTNENDRAVVELDDLGARFIQDIKHKYPLHKLERSANIMKSLRMIKSRHEIDLIQKACNITEKAFRRVLSSIKPGMMEYEVEADITHEFLRNGAQGHAYYPIIAGGNNACILHYNDNCAQLQDGDLILMDFGSEYAHYASDLTRTIPINGKFTKEQREVYDAVLRTMRYAMTLLKPGLHNLPEYNDKVGVYMQGELLKLGLITQADIDKQDPEWPAYKKYFMHGTSHHLGVDVHDLCHRYEKFQAGMVFTCEPGIYIPFGSAPEGKKQYEGIGIRIENDLLINSTGEPTDLMANIPIEADDIERLMVRS